MSSIKGFQAIRSVSPNAASWIAATPLPMKILKKEGDS